MAHNIISVRYAQPIPDGMDYQPIDAPVVAQMESGREEYRRANDDIGDGGMIAYREAGGVIEPYVPPAPSDSDIDTERDRRIERGLWFNGTLFQFGADSRENIMGAATLASIALTLGGVSPGNLFWHGGQEQFRFLSADNTPIPMDAPTAIQFGQAGARWRSEHIFAGRAIKDGSYTGDGSIPADYISDAYWPAFGG